MPDKYAHIRAIPLLIVLEHFAHKDFKKRTAGGAGLPAIPPCGTTLGHSREHWEVCPRPVAAAR
jgi:hypothetical protein